MFDELDAPTDVTVPEDALRRVKAAAASRRRRRYAALSAIAVLALAAAAVPILRDDSTAVNATDDHTPETTTTAPVSDDPRGFFTREVRCTGEFVFGETGEFYVDNPGGPATPEAAADAYLARRYQRLRVKDFTLAADSRNSTDPAKRAVVFTYDDGVTGELMLLAESPGDSWIVSNHKGCDAVRAKEGKRSSTPPCVGNNLHISLGDRGSAMGHWGTRLIFRNTGTEVCEMTGYPEVAGLNDEGRQIDPARRTPTGYIGWDTSEPPAVLILKPGDEASAVLEGSNVPTGEATTCPTYDAIRVSAPGESVSVVFDGPWNNCDGMEIHPLVAGATGKESRDAYSGD